MIRDPARLSALPEDVRGLVRDIAMSAEALVAAADALPEELAPMALLVRDRPARQAIGPGVATGLTP